ESQDVFAIACCRNCSSDTMDDVGGSASTSGMAVAWLSRELRFTTQAKGWQLSGTRSRITGGLAGESWGECCRVVGRTSAPVVALRHNVDRLLMAFSRCCRYRNPSPPRVETISLGQCERFPTMVFRLLRGHVPAVAVAPRDAVRLAGGAPGLHVPVAR